MNEHVSKTADCQTCAQDIEYVDGIADPYWRHTRGQHNHAAQPAPGTVSEAVR